MIERLHRLESEGRHIGVAVVGAGFVGRALIHQLNLTPAMGADLIVARDARSAVVALQMNGKRTDDVMVSDDPGQLDEAIGNGRPAVTTRPEALTALTTIQVVVEATGDVEHGARVAIAALDGGKHLVSLNYETDATVGPLLNHWAAERDLVYTGSDGDQPGVMKRLVDYVGGIGLEVVAAVNCKGFLDVHATPESIKPWAEKQGTSLHMTTAFTDGTKMNIENVSVANATGLVPARRGMHGVRTTLADAIADFATVLDRNGVVDYTLGGDFGSGVFVIATGADASLAAPYLEYLKMGPGPWYLFFRPWHLVQFETPMSVAEAVLDHLPTIAPRGAPVAQAISIAKRDLDKGQIPDGMGGYDVYGQIDIATSSEGLLPVGLADKCTVTEATAADTPISLDSCELDEESPIVRLWREQSTLFDTGNAPDLTRASLLWGGR